MLRLPGDVNLPARGRRPGVALLVAAAALVAGGCAGDSSERASARKQTFEQFRSRPDLRPPVVFVTTPARDTAPGYIFVAPKKEDRPSGPAILDSAGQLVWFHPVEPPAQAADFRVQRYRGQPVLTWWEGTQPVIGVGDGSFVMMDASYRRIAEVRAGNGLAGDLHEFLITPQDTALLLAYERVRRDLSPVGGPKDGHVFDNVVQEVDIETGRVLFEWRSLDHVPLVESALRKPAKTPSAKKPFDYFHVNSVSLDGDGALLVSARNTHAVYKISRRDGSVLWTLGGRNSDFELAPGTKFAFQHDAQRQADGTIRLFDNSALPAVAERSRAIVLRLDMDAMRASLVRAYTHPEGLLSPHQGNAQRLPNGNVFVGWGGKPYFTEFGEDGDVLFDAHLAIGDTYRAYRFPWTGRPAEPPAVAARAGAGDGVIVYASWNGATGVARWEVLAGPDADALEPVETADRAGFETAIAVETEEAFVAVRALAADGDPLGTSRAIEPTR